MGLLPNYFQMAQLSAEVELFTCTTAALSMLRRLLNSTGTSLENSSVPLLGSHADLCFLTATSWHVSSSVLLPDLPVLDYLAYK